MMSKLWTKEVEPEADLEEVFEAWVVVMREEEHKPATKTNQQIEAGTTAVEAVTYIYHPINDPIKIFLVSVVEGEVIMRQNAGRLRTRLQTWNRPNTEIYRMRFSAPTRETKPGGRQFNLGQAA